MTPEEILKTYWPLLLLAAWFAYRWQSSRRVLGKLPDLKRRGAMFIDVRTPQEFSAASANRTVNVPILELAGRLNEIPRERPVVLCCASGTRSAMATRTLQRRGYTEVYNAGSWRGLDGKL